MRTLIFICLLFNVVLLKAVTRYVDTKGNDNNSGTLSQPFKTLRKAVNSSNDGDVIEMRNGTYISDEIKIEINNLTIRSYPGEWAKIEAPVDKGEAIAAVLWYSDPNTVGGLLERIEIVGGAFYGLFFDSNWNWGLPVNQRSGVSGISIKGCKIHDTGRDCIKITPGCNDIQIIDCEIYNSGVGPENLPVNGGPNAEGIDNVNGARMIVRNCYFHDISTNGLYAKGGSKGSIIENNLIRNVGDAGIGIGFYTDGEWFDPVSNPKYYESIQTIVRNNFIINSGGAGLLFCGAYQCEAYNNTVITSSPKYHSPLTFLSGEVGVDDQLTVYPISKDIKCFNNIFIDQSPTNDDEHILLLRENALEGTNLINYNIYFKSNGSSCTFDDNGWPALQFSSWKTKYGYDNNSLETNPNLNNNLHLTQSSKAINAGKATFVNMLDYDGENRTSTIDIGADEFANGAELSIPPPNGTIGTGNKNGTTSSIDINQSINLLIYPNPTSDIVEIQAVEPIKQVVLYSTDGKLIRKSESKTNVSLRGLIDGVYILVVELPNSTSSHIIVKQ